MRLAVLFFLLLGLSKTNAQVDSLFMSYGEFYSMVLENHPVVRQADLQVNFGEAALLQARGGFDPKIASTFDRKSIGGEDYFNHWVSQLKIPVWAGIDFKVEREQNTGERLNPELSNQQTFTGFSIPVGRGLLIENRRATLLDARIYQNITQAERQKMINKIVFSAAKDYWEWYLSFKALELQGQGLTLARDRFNLIKEQARVGEKAAIDSVEAKITLQTRQVDYENAKIAFKNQSLFLSNYLWDSAENPLEISDNIFPPPIPSYFLDENKLRFFLDQAATNHPEITKLNLKYQQIGVQERLARENFKPQLNLDFGYLDTPKYGFSDFPIANSNHKLGLDFSFPLLLRKERGKLQEVKIKQIENELQRRQLSREILNDVNASYNMAKNLEELIQIQQDAADLQVQLLEAERLKFSIGESSLFLINSRENKLLEILLKIEELKSKYEKAVAELIYSAGLSSING